MAIELENRFDVCAPMGDVWEFLLSPEKLAECMPGASLTLIAENRVCEGQVSLRIGAIMIQYRGSLEYALIDQDQRKVNIAITAKEKSGGTVKGNIEACLTGQDDDSIRVVVNSTFNLTGRLVQVGRGLIEGASNQIIHQFVDQVKVRLESTVDEVQSAPEKLDDNSAVQESSTADSINVISVVWTIFRNALRGLMHRLFKV